MWEWAAQNVNFARAPAYDTPLHGPYDPEFMPFWKLPAEWLTDPTVKEITIWKSSRAGGSENILLNAIRYHAGHSPARILYISGDEKAAKDFMRERIKLGLECADACPQGAIHWGRNHP